MKENGRKKKKYTLEDFLNIIAQLRAPDGCPWDKEQTHGSLRNAMIEEAYEAAEGIDIYEKTGDDENLKEELGDVLLQVIMHSQIAKEAGRFDFAEVVDGVAKKMVYRHPHVFAEEACENSEQVLQKWEDLKKIEKNETTLTAGLEKIAHALPATIRAEKVQKKVAKAGLGYENIEEVLEQMQELLNQLKEEQNKTNIEQQKEKFEELIFTMTHLSRFLHINTENSLTNATDKFINRVSGVEQWAEADGKALDRLSIREYKELWGRIK